MCQGLLSCRRHIGKREDPGDEVGQQLKPEGTEASFGTTVITATILFIISILFSRVTVNVLVFVLRVVFFHLIAYVVTRYMYDAVRRVISVTMVILIFTLRNTASCL